MSQDFLDKQKAYFDSYSADTEFIETKASQYEFVSFVNFMGGDLKGKRILDLGCGTGRFGIKLANLTSAEVIGIDISDVSIEKANALAKEKGVNNFHAIMNDFKDVEFEEQFDVVVCLNMLHHTNERERIAENIYKSLKPGGTWIIIENNPLNPLFIPFFILIRQLRAHFTWQYLKANKYSLKSLAERHKFKIIEIQRYSFLPSMLYNYSSFFISINNTLNKLPIVNELAAFHLIKAIKQ